MRNILAFVFLLSCSLACAERQVVVKRSLSCEDYLSPVICTSLSNAVKHLNLSPSTIVDGIMKALEKGNMKPTDIYKSVLNFLREKVNGENCEKFLAPKMCQKIRDALSPWNIAKQTGKIVVETILKGPPTKYELFLRVLNAVRKELQGKSCDEILAAKLCRQLREMATKLLITAAKRIGYLIESAISGHKTQDQMYNAVVDYYRQDAAPLQCSDILSAKVCKSLNDLGDLFKVSPEEISTAIKEAILKGKTSINEIVDEVKAFVKRIASAKKCEDLIPAQYCSTLRDIATKLKIDARQVDEAISEALEKGKADFQQIKEFCEDYFKTHVSCEAWLGSKTCGYLRNFATKLGVQMKELEQKITDLIVQNDTKVSQLFEDVVNFIKGKIFG